MGLLGITFWAILLSVNDRYVLGVLEQVNMTWGRVWTGSTPSVLQKNALLWQHKPLTTVKPERKETRIIYK